MAKIHDLIEKKKLRDRAKKSGELPHEFLLRVSRGEPVLHYVENDDGTIEQKQFVPTWRERIKAAEMVAPYFAPKLASQVVNMSNTSEELADVFKNHVAKELPV